MRRRYWIPATWALGAVFLVGFIAAFWYLSAPMNLSLKANTQKSYWAYDYATLEVRASTADGIPRKIDVELQRYLEPSGSSEAVRSGYFFKSNFDYNQRVILRPGKNYFVAVAFLAGGNHLRQTKPIMVYAKTAIAPSKPVSLPVKYSMPSRYDWHYQKVVGKGYSATALGVGETAAWRNDGPTTATKPSIIINFHGVEIQAWTTEPAQLKAAIAAVIVK